MSIGVEVYQVKNDGELNSVPLDPTSLEGALIVVDHDRKNIWFWMESEELPKRLKILGSRIIKSLKLKYGFNYSINEIMGDKEPGTFLMLFGDSPKKTKPSDRKISERRAEFTRTSPIIVKMAKGDQELRSEKKSIIAQPSKVSMLERIPEIPISVNININLENFESFDSKKLEDLIKAVRDVLKNL
ncbi:MAG: hypothetical protein ACUVXA_05650 [Candidatus Jordarchaeum sp.]|uniref:hypothetical protein n=1 Tax=Candidatus Jordarchaeum sp. TaxID=2823881 RepID=UPI00404A7E24